MIITAMNETFKKETFCPACGQASSLGHTPNCDFKKPVIKSRTILDSKNNPHPEGLIESMDDDWRRQEIETQERDPELEKVLESIDFDTLRTIFEDYAVRSGISKEGMNFITKERIKPVTLEKNLSGRYNALKNIILLSPKKISEFFPNREPLLAIIEVLAHEETHAVVKNKITVDIHVTQKDNIENRTIQSDTMEGANGYRRGATFRGFNEGMIEKLSREVRDRYVATKPDLVKMSEPKKIGTYHAEVAIVDALIKRIALEVGVSEQTVWQGFIRGLFEGENLQDPELSTAFNEMFDKKFIEKLSKVETDEECVDVINTIAGERIIKFFNIYIRFKK